jgi:hypothetical protein
MTSFARQWGELLVKDFVEHGPLGGTEYEPRLTELRSLWLRNVSARDLPWYAEEKLRKGAYSSLLGLVLSKKKPHPAEGGTWRAYGIGDSCLFHVRQEILCAHFPMQSSESFTYHPTLLGSVAKSDAKAPALQYMKGEWRVGDRFLLMTDALAEWFLKSAESGGRPWSDVLAAFEDGRGDVPETTFQAWIRNLEDSGRIRNDDVTAMIVEVEDDVRAPATTE